MPTPPSPLEPDSGVTYSFEYIGEGRCEDYGMTAIANKEECRLAGATVDGHPEKPIREDARIRDRPGPCLIHKFQRNSATRPTEWFPNGQQACTAKGSGYDCICKKPTSSSSPPVTYIKLQYKGTSNGLCASMGSSNAGSAGCATSATCKDNGKSDLTLQTCNDNDDFQLWNLEEVADDDGYVFHSKADPTRCMYTGSSPAHGGCEPFTLAACDTSDTRQVFKQEAYGGSSIWRNVATNLAIDVNSYRNSVDNWVWGCGGRNNAKKFDAIALSPPEPAKPDRMLKCVDSRKRGQNKWIGHGRKDYTEEEARAKCAGYKYMSLECPTDKTKFEVWCANDLSGMPVLPMMIVEVNQQ